MKIYNELLCKKILNGKKVVRQSHELRTSNEEISLNNGCIFFGYFEITSNTLLQPFILPISSIAVNSSEVRSLTKNIS